MSKPLNDLIQQRMRRARQAFRVGKESLRLKAFEDAINRFYYAAFYAAKAVLATKELDSSKHKGVITLFHLHFVKEGLIDSETAKALAASFEERLDTDYGDYTVIDAKRAGIIRDYVEKFIKSCSFYLKKYTSRH